MEKMVEWVLKNTQTLAQVGIGSLILSTLYFYYSKSKAEEGIQEFCKNHERFFQYVNLEDHQRVLRNVLYSYKRYAEKYTRGPSKEFADVVERNLENSIQSIEVKKKTYDETQINLDKELLIKLKSGKTLHERLFLTMLGATSAGLITYFSYYNK